MKLTEEQREIALRVAKDAFNTESHRAWSYEGGDANVIDFAARFLAALPKPEPVGEMVNTIGATQLGTQFETRFKHVEFKKFNSIPIGTKFYTEAPIAPPASEQKPIAWVTTNEDGDYAMLFFDKQEARSYSGDDEPIGLAPVSSSAPQPDYKAQRDALLEELEKAAVAFWKLDNADIHAQEAESTIASVKGGE